MSLLSDADELDLYSALGRNVQAKEEVTKLKGIILGYQLQLDQAVKHQAETQSDVSKIIVRVGIDDDEGFGDLLVRAA